MKTDNITLTATLALAFIFSCSDDGNDGDACPSAVVGNNTMSCGGQTYRTVKIGTQTWMAENLNYDVSGSVCYGNDLANCKVYGRLYNWSAAMGICPSGWHIPGNAEWDKLIRHADGNTGTSSPYGSSTAGKDLKAKSGWSSSNGQDTYGFSALPGGYGGSDGYFYYAGSYGSWWSSSEYGSNYAYRRSMDSNDESTLYYYLDKSFLFSVRCVRE
jgi:uncharacterized protein (TIGR02145 family)